MDKPKNYELRTMHATLCQAIADPTRIALLYELGGPRPDAHRSSRARTDAAVYSGLRAVAKLFPRSPGRSLALTRGHYPP